MSKIKHQDLADVSKLTRKQVVPYYTNLILASVETGNALGNPEVLRINKLILSKWTDSALDYIKKLAWRDAENIKAQL